MSETGRYIITDHETGRRFWVEPIGRTQEKVFTNGGPDGTSEKNKSTPKGGAIAEEESQITEENGFAPEDITIIGPYMSPENFIAHVCKEKLKLNDPSFKRN